MEANALLSVERAKVSGSATHRRGSWGFRIAVIFPERKLSLPPVLLVETELLARIRQALPDVVLFKAQPDRGIERVRTRQGLAALVGADQAQRAGQALATATRKGRPVAL